MSTQQLEMFLEFLNNFLVKKAAVKKKQIHKEDKQFALSLLIYDKQRCE